MIKILNSKPFRVLHNVFLGFVMSYGIGLIFFGLPFRIWGQPTSHDDIERRVSMIEGQNLEHRLTVMETTMMDLQNSAFWTRLNMGGTGLLIAEAVTRTVRKKEVKRIIE